jgi:hypothetical protein
MKFLVFAKAANRHGPVIVNMDKVSYMLEGSDNSEVVLWFETFDESLTVKDSIEGILMKLAALGER